MLYLTCYVLALCAFAVLDAIWLGATVSSFYRPLLGDLMAESVRKLPAILFYLGYPVGLVVFAILPALKSGGLIAALGFGALFGAMAYGTYNLTNFATLRNWTWSLTLVDMAWGAIGSGLASAAALAAARAIARQFGW